MSKPKKKSKKGKKTKLSPWDNTTERWFEIVDALPPDRFVRLELPFLAEHRVFVRGRINKVTIVEVPQDMPRELVMQMGKQLSEGGIEALVVTPSVRFMNLRAVSDEEERLFREQRPEATKITIPRSHAGQRTDVPGDGPEPEGVRDGGDRPAGDGASSGDGEACEDDREEAPEAGEDRSTGG